MSHVNKNGTLVPKVVCAIFFLLFTFLYLYAYQGDILAVTQHVLSHGVTHYNIYVGSVLITLVLWLIQIAIHAATGLNRRAYALTYLPSLLLLAILTDISPSVSIGNYLGNWIWGFPLLMVAYAVVVWVVRQLETMEPPAVSLGLFSRMTWINLLQMVVMAFIVCGIGCSDKVFHYRMRIEDDILDHDYAEAVQVGKDEAVTDSSLTMLRVWALSDDGKLAESLFEYPLVGGSDAMLPNGSSVRLMMVPEQRLYADLGVVFRQKMRPIHYLEKLNEKGFATEKAHDWLLCAYLLDGRLDDFAKTLPRYYDLTKNLPKAYREALVLYNHQRRQPHVVYHNAVMDADFEDFQKVLKTTGNKQVCRALLKESYGKTYWFYSLTR